jgi:CheY-like chemotaxis protein
MNDHEQVAGWHVLIVDDHADSLEVAAITLGMAGVHVYTAHHGQEGLQVLAGITPTFILLDLSMPVMNGWEMLRRVRSDPRLASVPVIALTAHAMTGDAERALDAGFDHYFTKPFSPFTFLDDLLTAFQANPQLAARLRLAPPDPSSPADR